MNKIQLEDGSGFSSPGWTATRDVARFEDSYLHVEGLVNLDADHMLWRTRHLKVIERTIGARATGLAGTPIDVMAKLPKRQLFPALWETRYQLTDEAGKGPLAYSGLVPRQYA